MRTVLNGRARAQESVGILLELMGFLLPNRATSNIYMYILYICIYI